MLSPGIVRREGRCVAKAKAERYEIDPEDGLRREIVGEWVEDKHLLLRAYVDITGPTRAKYTSRSYCDLYCGPGRARLKDTDDVVDGSAVLAVKQAAERAGSQFTAVHIGDSDKENLSACEARLSGLGLRPQTHLGAALDTAGKMRAQLHSNGLHLAFLDPYSIGALPFDVIRTLAQLQRMDLIIHVSIMDLQRNFERLIEDGRLNAFAPGFSQKVDPLAKAEAQRLALFRHWRSLLEQELKYSVSDNVERVSGTRNQPLYWLVYASRHSLGEKLWKAVTRLKRQPRLL
jgi:three-Cys-motif partner protein